MSLKFHGWLDWILIAAALPMPWVLGFHVYREATVYFMILAGAGLLLNALTNYPAGLIRKIPFRTHRLVEWSTPPAFMIFPWISFSEAGLMPVAITTLGLIIFLNATFVRPDSK